MWYFDQNEAEGCLHRGVQEEFPLLVVLYAVQKAVETVRSIHTEAKLS